MISNNLLVVVFINKHQKTMSSLELDPIPIPTEKLGVEFSPNGKVGIREVVGINLN